MISILPGVLRTSMQKLAQTSRQSQPQAHVRVRLNGRNFCIRHALWFQQGSLV